MVYVRQAETYFLLQTFIYLTLCESDTDSSLPTIVHCNIQNRYTYIVLVISMVRITRIEEAEVWFVDFKLSNSTFKVRAVLPYEDGSFINYVSYFRRRVYYSTLGCNRCSLLLVTLLHFLVDQN